MKNRLLLSWKFRLLLSALFLLTTSGIYAQCECSGNNSTCMGDVFTMTVSGPRTKYVSASACSDTLKLSQYTVSFNPAPSTVTGAFISGGYSDGDLVPAGTTVTITYIVSTNPVVIPVTRDTLCYNILFRDTIPPKLNYVPKGDSAECTSANFTAWWESQMDSIMLHATDNCGIDTFYHSRPDTITDNCGDFVDTFYVEDIHGNIAFAVATYKIRDFTSPTINGVPADIIIQCNTPAPPPPVLTATDLCAGTLPALLVVQDTMFQAGACGAYTIRRIWAATDGCSPPARDTQLIMVRDTIRPDFMIPPDITIDCATSIHPSSTGDITNVTDNCDPFPTIAIPVDVVTTGTCPVKNIIMRTWIVTDRCGNSRSRTQKITVTDNTPPVATFPPDITVDCSLAGNLSATGQPTGLSDNCGPAITSRVDVNVAGSCPNSYTIQRTWTVRDSCGNTISDLQIITVTDLNPPVIGTQAQNRTIVCNDAVNADSVFNAWIAAHGNAVATDNCTVPANMTWTAVNSGTNTTASLPPPDCMNPTAGVYRRRSVDFIVADQCGRRDTTTATFTVQDLTPPVVSNCPSDTTITTDTGSCDVALLLPLPIVTEECGNTTTPINLSLTSPLTIPSGSDPVETPVDDLVFNFPVQGPPSSAKGSGTLTIILNDVDAEAPTEFLNVYGEDGMLLGPANHTPVQCSTSTTTFTLSQALMNAWAFDGTLTITLKPNIPSGQPGRFSVNPICTNNNVTAQLAYTEKTPNHLKFEYSINAGPRIPVSPVADVPEVLQQGSNTILYYFTDCAGNESGCSFEVTVEDQEIPQIICPPNMMVTLDPDSCRADVEVPLFASATDNCAITPPTTQTQPSTPGDSLITYSYNPNLNDFVADDKVFTFTGLPGNATPGSVQLIITLQADVDSIGEYFQIYDNDDNLLGTTSTGTNCSTPNTTTFSIPATTFNAWANAGDIKITARSFMSYPIPPAGPGWGINPCDTSMVHNDGDMDGSFIHATIRYESVAPKFEATGATTIAQITLNPPLQPQTYTLNQGTTTFSYKVTDLAGNEGECTFDIEVKDMQAPTALCGPAFVEINPSGFLQDTIFPNEIDLGSSDNCMIASMTVTPNIITCNSAGIMNVTLTVTDNSNNVSTCNTFVNITNTRPQPTALSNCGSSSLQLFANPPPSTGGGNAFQYTWRNPNGVIISFLKDPVIQNAGISEVGFYTVEIEGVTGCKSSATVQVTCDLLPLQKPVAQAVNSQICSDQNIQLTTAAVCGNTTQYKWYTGIAPNSMLIGTTNQPSFSMMPPASGTYNFYVIVSRNGCDSEASANISVQVRMKPTAMPSQSSFVLCEGQQILLNSINNPPGTTCHWTGPCGFESFNCSPPPINNTTTCNSGLYQLIVSNGSCASEPAFVAVNVVAIPPQPALSNSTSQNNPACDGSPITLTATPIQGATYRWTTPMFTTIITDTNVLSIPVSDISKDAGQWTVKAIGNPCESMSSQPTTVYISPRPQGVTSAASPASVCEGQSVQLSASTGSPSASYLWSFPNGQTSALQNPVLNNVTSSNAGTYTVTVSNQFGCSAQKSLTLTVLNRVNITGVSSNAPECASGPVTVNLNATVFPMDNGTYTYSWTGPNGFTSSSASATIPNATINNSGPYTLVVTNAQGCSSLPKTLNVAIPAILPTPGAPALSANNPFCPGDNLTLTTTAYPGSDAKYIWNTPTGSYTTTTPSLPINGMTLSDGGTYTVRYMVNNCLSAQSGSTSVTVNPAPVILPTTNSPVCESQVLQLAVECTTGANYEWTGPGGFSSSVCNPTIANISPALHAGTYNVRKRVNGCWSAVAPVEVNVKPKPKVPSAVNAGPYCGNKDNVVLSVTASSATPGAMYTWYNNAGEPLGAATSSLNFSVPNPAQYGNGNREFYVVASLDGCPSLPSVPTVVSLNTIPSNLAEAGPDVQACQGQILTLKATPVTVGSGKWTLAGGNPAGVTIANPDQATTTVGGLVPGQEYLFQWSLSNGACMNYSRDTAKVEVDVLEQAEAGAQVFACHTNMATLKAATPISSAGMWTQPSSQAALGIVITNPTSPSSPITGLVPGNTYIFTWTITGGCGSSSDDVLVVASNEDAFAGQDIADCGEGCSTLNAVAPLSGNGRWTSPDPTITFATPTSPASAVCNLKTGNNILVWTTNNGACGHFSMDSVMIGYQFLPEVVEDEVKIPFGGFAEFDATANDIIQGSYTVKIAKQPLNGKLEVGINGKLTYTGLPNFTGIDNAIYEVCVDDCECASGNIKFIVGENSECIPPTIITPNHDGINDAFAIPCLADGTPYPNSTVRIFNQWGDEVFQASPYKNNWQGTFDGEDLPVGTYFFIVDLGNGDKPMSGYLILQR